MRKLVKFYVLYDYRTDYIFYIGFAKKPSLEAHINSSFSLRTRVDQYIFSMQLDRVEVGMLPLEDGYIEDLPRFLKRFPKSLNAIEALPDFRPTEQAIRDRFQSILGKDGVDKLLLHLGY